jgi:hypothetical protein
MVTQHENYAPECICGQVHWRGGCSIAAEMDRSVWRERQAAREAAQGFRYVNQETPDILLRRPKRQVERSCRISASVGDFYENFR